MPYNHGTQHWIYFLLGIILSAILEELCRQSLPGILKWFNNEVSLYLINAFNLPFSPNTASKLIIAFLIVISLGVFFGHLEKRKRGKG